MAEQVKAKVKGGNQNQMVSANPMDINMIRNSEVEMAVSTAKNLWSFMVCQKV